MAYAAVLSLKNTIHHFLNSSHISLVPASRKILEFAGAEATSLQQVLKRLDDKGFGSRKSLDVLDGRIREAVHKMEDVLEFHESNQISSSSSSSRKLISIDLEEIREELLSLYETVKEMEEEYVKVLEKEADDEDEDEDDEGVWSSSDIDFGVEMVGQSDEYAEMQLNLVKQTRPDDLCVFLLYGVPGLGTKITVKRMFDDMCSGQETVFDCGAWASVGTIYQLKQILGSILSQIHPGGGINSVLDGDDDNIKEYLRTSLKGRRSMIVLDGVWDEDILDHIISCFPERDNGSVLIVITSLSTFKVRSYYHVCTVYKLTADAVWGLVRTGIVSDAEPWPLSTELEEAGKKIAKNTKGCLLQMVKVMLALWTSEKTPEYWNKLAAHENNPIFMVDDEISEIRKIQDDFQMYSSVLDDTQRKLAGKILDLINFSPDFETMKEALFPKRFFRKTKITSFCGMPGVGKTTFVRKLLADSSLFDDIEHRVWITLGPKYQSERILVDILAQIYPKIDKRRMIEDAGLVEDLRAKLYLKKILVVLDDVWNRDPLHYLKKLFPDIKGKILLTTRSVDVAKFEQSDQIHEVRLLNLEESWSLFCRKVFDDGVCPPKLEKAGKKISEGLPLLILTVADLLSKVEKTPEYWSKVAEKKNPLFVNAQNKLTKILWPSYVSLPQHLKVFFLYMGVFPQSHEIRVSKLINLWNAEGFHDPNSCKPIEDFVLECLLELANRNLVMVCRIGFEIYRLHSVFWYLSTTVALKSTFFQALSTYTEYSTQDIQRLCIHNNVLLSIKEVCNSITSLSSAHSFLCNGPLHPYQVPIYFDFRLLRVMDAVTIRLYEFPIDFVKLIHLRYLALTCNGKIPASISKLWSLQYLIVHRYLSVKSSEDSSYLPTEIWGMKELIHLQVMGGHMPDPKWGDFLPNLVTLLDTSSKSCTERVLNEIPNLKKLSIKIELAPGSNLEHFLCLTHLWRLHKLESFKCVVVNPEVRSKYLTAPSPCPIFPSSLKKLSLSGLGYPWSYMNTIGELENLQVLKLRCFAFQGPKWEIDDYFYQVKSISFHDIDLEHWGVEFSTLANLKHLSFKHCYKLKKLPDVLNPFIEKIEVVDCNPFAATWANHMKELAIFPPYFSKHFHIRSSWDAANMKQ